MDLIPDLQANPMDLVPEIACPVGLLLSDFGFRHRYTPFPIGALCKALPSIAVWKYRDTQDARQAERAPLVNLSPPWTSSI